MSKTADEWERDLGHWRVCPHDLEGGFCEECAAEIRRVFTDEGRAAGFAEAIEKAAKLVDERGCGSSFCLHPGAIRKLAPAATASVHLHDTMRHKDGSHCTDRDQCRRGHVFAPDARMPALLEVVRTAKRVAKSMHYRDIALLREALAKLGDT